MPFEPIDHYDPGRGGHAFRYEDLQPRELVAIDLVSPVLRRGGGKLLDVGCGSGVFLAALDERLSLAERGWVLHGVDYSQFQIEAARSRPYEFAQCNVEDGLPFDDGALDVIFCGELIEHLYDPDSFLDECHRVLAAEGHLVITTPNLQAWYNRVLFLVGVQPVFYEVSTRSTQIGAGPLRRLKRGSVPVGHIRLLNARALRDLCASRGFRVLELRGATFAALPTPAKALDRVFTPVPSLASILVALVRRER